MNLWISIRKSTISQKYEETVQLFNYLYIKFHLITQDVFFFSNVTVGMINEKIKKNCKKIQFNYIQIKDER